MATKQLTFFLLIVLALNVFSAWPYQLNLSNGVLYDTNASNNATNNFTIYVVNQIYILNNTYILNYTINNTIYTNLTTYLNQTNLTCVNCTNINNTTYSIKGSGTLSLYNKSEIDTLFVTLTNFNDYKASIITIPRAEFDVLAAKVNVTLITDSTGTSHGSLWGGIIICWLLLVVAIYFIVKSSGGSYETIY
jgi:hypothetical protein